MIGFSFVYIFFAFIIIIGVIFVIYGLSQPRHGSTGPAAAGNNDDFDDPVEEVIDLVRVVEEGNVTEYKPEIPKKFDPNFIQQQLAKVQHSPNVIVSYISSLETRFRNNQEMKILKDYNLLVAEGVSSEAEIYRKRTELEDAKHEWLLASDGSYQQLKGDDAKRRLQASIFDSEVKIAEAKAKIRNHETPSQQEKSTRRTPEEKREQFVERLNVQAEDMTRLDEWRKEKLSNLDARMAGELRDLEDLPLSEEEKNKRRMEIKARYARQREEILKAKFK